MDWYYVKDGEKQGPVSGTELRRLAKDGRILPADLVWRDGMPDWILARKVRGLFEESKEAAETPTPADAKPSESVDDASPSSSEPRLETPFAPDSTEAGDSEEAKPGAPDGAKSGAPEIKPPEPKDEKKSKPGRAVRDIVLPEIISSKSPEAVPTAKVEPSTPKDVPPAVQISLGEEKAGRKAAPNVGPVQINTKRETPAPEAAPAQPTEPAKPAIPVQPAAAPAQPAVPAAPTIAPPAGKEKNVEAQSPAVAAANIVPPVVAPVEATPQEDPPSLVDAGVPVVSRSASTYKGSSHPAEMTHLFDFILNGICSVITPSFVDASCRMLLTIGHYGLYGAMLIAFATGVIFAVQTEAFLFIGIGIALALALLVLQFVGTRFSEALESLVRASQGKIHSTALLDALAFLFLTIGSGILLLSGLGVLAAANLGGFKGILSVLSGLLIGLTCFVTCLFAAAVSLCPESVHVTEEEAAGPGEQALGLFGFLANLLARTTVVLYGTGVALGTIGLVLALALSFSSDDGEAVEPEADSSLNEFSGEDMFSEEYDLSYGPTPDLAYDPGYGYYEEEMPESSLLGNLGFGASLTASLYLVILSACAPAFVYLGLLAIMLQLSVLRAILSMGKRPLDVRVTAEGDESDDK